MAIIGTIADWPLFKSRAGRSGRFVFAIGRLRRALFRRKPWVPVFYKQSPVALRTGRDRLICAASEHAEIGLSRFEDMPFFSSGD